MTHRILLRLFVFTFLGFVASAGAQNLINVKLAGGTQAATSGAAVVGTAGDAWNVFASLGARANGGGVVTNAATIKDSSGTTLAGVSMTMSLSGGDGLDSYNNSPFSPIPALIMANYVYENAGANYFTFTFTGLPANKAYLLYGMGNGDTSGQGTTWWVDTVNGHATASATANFASGSRDATLAGNEGICWVKLPATTTAAGALTFRVVRLNAAENGTGGSGRAYLNAFQLQPLSAPVTTGLTNQTVVAGNTANLTPTTTGVLTPTYQWRSNGTNIVAATNASLSLANVQYSQNGFTYALVASNYVGAVTNSMTLTVIVTPAITGLTNQAVPVGADVTMAGTVSGVPTPTLQWRREGTNLAGATASSYFIPNAQTTASGNYSLVASNSAGIVTNSMTLTVSFGDVAPSITGPTDQTVVQTSNATFTASVSGLPIPTVQWRVNSADIPGATSSSLTISNVQYSQNGFVYSLVASNSAGMATNSANLFVLVPPTISQQPTNLAVTINTPATFNVGASGVPSLKYQWRRNGSPLANATNAAYTIASAQGADNGAVFSVVVSNSVAVVTSSNGTLTVLSTIAGAFLPTNNATGISPDQQLRIVFSGGTPKLGAGKLYVRNAADDSIFASIDTSQFITFTFDGATVTNGASRNLQGINCYYEPIAIEGNVAWVTFTNRFAYNKTYYVTADAGLFRDGVNASFPAISGTNTWRFSTKSSGPATPTASTGPTNITVGLDGAGDFATLQGASDWIPQNNTLRRNISIQPGTYRDYALFKQNRNTVTISGAGASPEDVLLYYPWPTGGSGIGVLTLDSSDINVLNLDLDTKAYLTFPGRMRSLITTGNRLVFENVLIKGGQDTLYTVSGSAYFNNCEVWGSVDFIYGGAVAVFDQCAIVEVRDTGGPITAPNTPYAQPYGLVFLNCSFPQATIAAGHPYNVGTGNTTFQRPWGQDGYTAIINCQLGTQFSTKGWGEWGGRENTCRCIEHGSTMIGGGAAPTVAARQSAGAYWLNSKDPNYTSASMDPLDASLAPPSGHLNRTNITVNPADYTLDAIFGHPYFGLGSWRPTTLPTITTQPTNKTASAGSATSLSVAAFGQPTPTYQWRKNGTNVIGQTNATLSFSSAKLADNGTYSVIVSNSAGTLTSSNAVLTIPALPTSITPTFTNGAINLSWPVNQTGYRLLAQTNPLSVGLTANWHPVGNSNSTNQVSVSVNPTNGSVFFRLVYP